MAVDRKKQIIEQSMKLFARDGYDGVTIKQIARACKITEPALYRHFPSKKEIYNAVLDSLKTFLDFRELFLSLEQETELKVIMSEMASHILVFFNRHRETYRLLLYSALREHSKARDVFREIRNPYVEFLTEQLDRLYAAGKIKKKNNEITARCFVGMVFDCALNATLWKGFQGKKYRPEQIIDNNVPIFVAGLSAGSRR